MALFKVNESWSCPVLNDKETCLCNNKSVVITRLHESGDSIIVGDYNGHLKIFRPQGQYTPSDLCLEITFNQPILQIGHGKYLQEDEQTLIAVLMPHLIIVFSFHTKEGHTDYGDQYVLVEKYNHKLPLLAHCFVSGQFGGTLNHELICVQSMDGWLIFYDQETTLFRCLLPEMCLPSPLEYVTKSDAFVTLGPGWTLNFYGYNHLSQTGTLTKDYSQSVKKITCEWSYNIGENVHSIQSLQITNDCSAIVALGERSIYCIHDNGILKFMLAFDYKPLCCYAYLIGWYYEPNSRFLILVASENSLFIYENNSMLWSCELIFAPVSMSRGYFKGLSGGLVLLGMGGSLTCCFLGTEPELFVPPPLPETANFSAKEIEDEIKDLEIAFNTLNGSENLIEVNEAAKRAINFSVEFKETDVEPLEIGLSNTVSILCKLHVTLKPNIDVEAITIYFLCQYPLITLTNIISVDTNLADNFIQNYIYIEESMEYTSKDVSLLVSFTNKKGQITTVMRIFEIPIWFFFKICEPTKEAECKLTIETKVQKPIDLMALFCEKTSEDSTVTKCSVLGLCKNNSKELVTIIPAKTHGRYRFQSGNMSSIYVVLKEFVNHLTFADQKYTDVKEYRNVILSEGVVEYLSYLFSDITKHAEIRVQLNGLENELTVLSSQFFLIQKRLLTKYCAYPPANCDGLEFLLKDTYTRITDTVKRICLGKSILLKQGAKLSASINMILLLLQLSGLKAAQYEELKEALCPDIFNKDFQGWEEIVCQSVPHLLRSSFSKQDKNSDKLAPLNNDDILLETNIKKMIKYIKLLIDRAVKTCNKPILKNDVEPFNESEDQVVAEDS